MAEINAIFLAKDFIETSEGLCFAVVQSGIEHFPGEDTVLCFLRYLKHGSGAESHWQKVGTDQANTFLKQHFPEYVHQSARLDAYLHGVSVANIAAHHRPRLRLQEMLAVRPRDKVEQDVVELVLLFERNGLDLTKVGVTGSLLINAQQPRSDIDLVIYDRESFRIARKITEQLIGKGQLGVLKAGDWQEAFARRSCTLDLEQYVWHERRKFNKALINGRKFDLNLVTEDIEKPVYYHKLGKIKIKSRVTDDWFSYDYPALYKIDHDEVRTVVCFIATYTGQAVAGETVEIAGLLEQSEQGDKRIVVGSSREAPGEYIKVINA